MRYGIDDQGITVPFLAWEDFFSLSTASIPALEPMQSVQCYLGFISPGVKQPKREAEYSIPSNAGVKVCMELYVLFSIGRNGVVFNLAKR
jgi:hypothetical protein